jgi:hypothetical protein
MAHSTAAFTWQGNKGTAEASDLHGGFNAGRQLVLTSTRTSASVVFFKTGTKRDAENDTLWWSYRSASGVELTVFND